MVNNLYILIWPYVGVKTVTMSLCGGNIRFYFEKSTFSEAYISYENVSSKATWQSLYSHLK